MESSYLITGNFGKAWHETRLEWEIWKILSWIFYACFLSHSFLFLMRYSKLILHINFSIYSWIIFNITFWGYFALLNEIEALRCRCLLVTFNFYVVVNIGQHRQFLIWCHREKSPILNAASSKIYLRKLKRVVTLSTSKV